MFRPKYSVLLSLRLILLVYLDSAKYYPYGFHTVKTYTSSIPFITTLFPYLFLYFPY